MKHNYIKQSLFKNIRLVLSQNFDKNKTETILNDANEMIAKLVEVTNFRNNKEIAMHNKYRILPAIAFYKALQKNNVEKEKAKEIISKYMNTETEKTAKLYRVIGKAPGFFKLFMFVFKKEMNKSFPIEGWKIEWLEVNNKKAIFNIKSCLYYEIFLENGCSELTPLFCHLDEIAYKNMSKTVLFERKSTIAQGSSCCDFKFIKNE